MKEIVIDSSVAVKKYIAEDNSEIAVRIFSEYEQGKLDFLAPDLIYAEFWEHRLEEASFPRIIGSQHADCSELCFAKSRFALRLPQI